MLVACVDVLQSLTSVVSLVLTPVVKKLQVSAGLCEIVCK